jgi:hypothetical protein
MGWEDEASTCLRILEALERSHEDPGSHEDCRNGEIQDRLARGLDPEGVMLFSGYLVQLAAYRGERSETGELRRVEASSRLPIVTAASALFHRLLGATPEQVERRGKHVPRKRGGLGLGFANGNAVIENRDESPIPSDERKERMSAPFPATGRATGSTAEGHMSLDDISASGLTPGQAYVLAANLALRIRESRRRSEGQLGALSDPSQIDGVHAELLQRLLWAATPRPDVSSHERRHAVLAGGIRPAMAAAFVKWLEAGATVGAGIHEHPHGRSWACARVLMELESTFKGIGQTRDAVLGGDGRCRREPEERRREPEWAESRRAEREGAERERAREEAERGHSPDHWMSEAGWAWWNKARPWIVGAGWTVAALSLRWFIGMGQVETPGPPGLLGALMAAAFAGWGAGHAVWALSGVAVFGALDAGPRARLLCMLGALALTSVGA